MERRSLAKCGSCEGTSSAQSKKYGRFSVRKRIVEQDNERELMESSRDARAARISKASKTSRISKKSDVELPPVKPPANVKPLS